jgi:hypothetical protein
MFDGLLKVNAYGASDEETKKIRDKFLEDVRTRAKGLPVLDNGADYVQVQRQLKMVDGATLSEIKENACIPTGVSVEMLTGRMSQEDKEAFFEIHIAPAAISLEQALSKAFFSRASDCIKIYPHKSQLMAMSEVVSLMQVAGPMGTYSNDEWREMTGHEPLPNGEGKYRPRGYNNLDGGNDAEEVTE